MTRKSRLSKLEQTVQLAQNRVEPDHERGPSWPIHKVEALRIRAALPDGERGTVEALGEQGLVELLEAFWKNEPDGVKDFPTAALRAYWLAFGGGPYLYGNAQECWAWSLLFSLPRSTGMGQHVRSFGDASGLERLYRGYLKVRNHFPAGEKSGAVAVAAYNAAFGEVQV